MNVINIEIKNKIAKTTSDVQYVCGNSDYLIRFSFDDEWDQYETKTARIVNGDGEYHDVVFTGCECDMPIISNAYAIKVGVFAGNLHTTTPAYVPAVKSILCGAGTPADPPEDVYAQIMEMLNAGGGEVTDEQIAQAVSKYLEENPIAGVTPEEVQGAVGAALEAAKDSGEFDGEDGYTPVKGKDYWTEADREQIVEEVLGEVGEGTLEMIETITLDEEVTSVARTIEPNGDAYKFSVLSVRTTFQPCSYSGNVTVEAVFGGNWQTGISGYMLNPYDASSKKYGYNKFWTANGRWRSGWWTCTKNHGEYANYYENPVRQEKYSVEDGYLTRVSLSHDKGLPVGTIIEIWGVRANA